MSGDGKRLVVGRYVLFDRIAEGGMATVHLGRLRGAAGFSRVVAIKRLHKDFARDPSFVEMFIDEARLVTRIRHPNVVTTLDVVTSDDELFLVMEYVRGVSLAQLVKAVNARGERIPPDVVAGIMSGVLQGLHAAHEACDANEVPLEIVHRDVSPQNILVGDDGMGRVVDFGVAKAASRVETTREGEIKGKFGYLAPEQLSTNVTRRADIFAATIVLWEALCGERLFTGPTHAAQVAAVLYHEPPPPSSIAPELGPYDAVVAKGLLKDPTKRYGTARELAVALQRCGRVASGVEIGEWLTATVGSLLAERAALVRSIERIDLDADDLDAPTLEHARSTIQLTPLDERTLKWLDPSVERIGTAAPADGNEGTEVEVSSTVSIVAATSVDAESPKPTGAAAPRSQRALGIMGIAVLVIVAVSALGWTRSLRGAAPTEGSLSTSAAPSQPPSVGGSSDAPQKGIPMSSSSEDAPPLHSASSAPASSSRSGGPMTSLSTGAIRRKGPPPHGVGPGVTAGGGTTAGSAPKTVGTRMGPFDNLGGR